MESQARTTIPRPESTIAQSFAAELEGMFGLSSDTDTLHQTVQEKKTTVSRKDQELQELEARLRQTEERLARVSRASSPARQPAAPPTAQANTAAPIVPPSRNPARIGESGVAAAAKQSPLAQKPAYPADRPPTAEQQRPQPRRDDTAAMMRGMPAALPETPRQYSGGGDYVMVDRSGRSTPQQYGQSVG